MLLGLILKQLIRKKSFHLHIILNIANTDKAGRGGITILQYILHSDAASILAASRSSFGIVNIYCLNKKTPVAVAAAGIITPHKEPNIPNDQTTKNATKIIVDATIMLHY